MSVVLRVCVCLLMGVSLHAVAGNTGGVFGPVINPTDRSLQYRYANALGEQGTDNNWAHRLHYQHALNDEYRVRVVGQYRDNQADFVFDQMRLELHWQFEDTRKTGGNWNSAVRFDFVGRDGDGPQDVGVHWTNQWTLSDQWNVTALLFTIRQLGDNRLPGVQVSTRYRLTYRYHNNHSVLLESFNNHGPINDLSSFDEQPQQIGPVLGGRWQGIGYKLSYLRGITSATPDDTFVLWLTYGF